MRRDDTRLQMLTLALFAILALVSLDLTRVQAVMDDYGLIDEPASGEAWADEQPAAVPREAQGPTLAVGGDKARPAARPACGAEIAIDVSCGERMIHVSNSLASVGTHVRIPLITSVWMDRTKTWSSLDAAAKALGLDEHQRASWQRTLDDARYEIDGLARVDDPEQLAVAHQRLVTSYKERLRADLCPEQQAIFDAHEVAPLFQSRAQRLAQAIRIMSKA